LSLVASPRKTECVTFPRSGHHALLACLHRYFGEQLRYCELYQPRQFLAEQGIASHGPMDEDPATNFQKNHDWDLKLRRRPGRLYLVQYRLPTEALASWYKLDLIDQGGEDTRPRWETFARRGCDFWRGFMRKWAIKPAPGTFPLGYERLVDSPEAALADVLRFLTGGAEPDLPRLRSALRAAPITRRNSARTFQHYDLDFFGDLLRRCRREIERAPGLAEALREP